MITRDNVIEYLESMGALLDEQDVPAGDRWIILKPYLAPRSRRWRLHKKAMKRSYFGMAKRGWMDRSRRM